MLNASMEIGHNGLHHVERERGLERCKPQKKQLKEKTAMA